MNTNRYDLNRDGYLASDETVAQMARDVNAARQTTDSIGSDYLRVLVAHSQDLLAKAAEQGKDSAIAAIAATHDRLYGVVLSAVITPDIEADDTLPREERARRAQERNRRSTFARTAKSTLLAFVRADGELGVLKPADVTKDFLRQIARLAAPPNAGRRTETLEAQLEATVKRLALEDREHAIDFIDQLHTRLMLIVARPLTELSTRRGDITFHPTH